MMPMPMRRKTRDMEKVEILCRTATAWKILPAQAARHQRCDPGRGQQADLEREQAAAHSLTREEGDGEREHDQIVVEHVGHREQARDRETRPVSPSPRWADREQDQGL
jgi:hypothetical protein